MTNLYTLSLHHLAFVVLIVIWQAVHAGTYKNRFIAEQQTIIGIEACMLYTKVVKIRHILLCGTYLVAIIQNRKNKWYILIQLLILFLLYLHAMPKWVLLIEDQHIFYDN